MKHSVIYTFFFAGFLFLGSCKKYVEVAPPRTSLSDELVFTDDKTAESSLTGLYSTMNSYTSSFANTQASFYPSMSADDFQAATASTTSDEFKDNGLTIGNSVASGLWSQPYSLIYHANAVIEGLNKSKSVSAAKSAQLVGEAKFLRAFFYFYLVNYFGDVPLVTNTDFLVNTSLPRTKSDIVYDAIIQDLLDAQAALSDNYPQTERIRANKGAATALLARVYLYRSQWDKAETESAKVIADAKYVLQTNINNVFLRTSTEAIWQLQAINTSTAGPINTWEAYSIIPINATTAPGYVMYPNFISSFESLTDKRYVNWLKAYTPTVGPTVYYPYKYKVRTGTVTEYAMVLRKAEQYLIRAEARAQLNNLAGAKADIDEIRIRAGLPVLAAGLTRDQLLLAVEKERKLELFTEWGHRWFDLIRTGRAIPVLGAFKTGVSTNDLVYPIPLDAMLTNNNLVQNPGY
ncbi:MAG: RagB/SusD family nutrient uptake outer membrane protein [Bacteroidota bacterium]